MNLNREQSITFVQDSVHIATKLRNRLLKLSILLPMCCKQVSVSHLKILIKKIGKDVHGLVISDIAPDDKQNFKSVEKITSDRVLFALQKYVPDSEATIKYLKLCREITQAFIDTNLKPLERISMIWNSLYFIRAWRKWMESTEYDPNKNFITQNSFTCIELNAYALLHLICKFRDAGKPELFLPGLFSSQPCESTFRQLRSMTTPNWTKINFTLLEVLHSIGRIEMQNDIAFFKLSAFVSLPRIQNQDAKHTIYELPTNTEIQMILKKAMDSAIDSAKEFGMTAIKADDIILCEIKKGKIPPAKPESENYTYKEIEDIDVNDTLDCSNFKDYSNQCKEFDGNSPFIQIIEEDGTSKIIRKSSILWVASESNVKVSNDRLKRVQSLSASSLSRKRSQKIPDNHHLAKKIKNILEINSVICIGQWCIFRNVDDLNHLKNESFQNIIIGCVLGFRYAGGRTQKEIQYGFDYAELSSDKEIEVLATWYKCSESLRLLSLSPKQNFFLSIKNYIATIDDPEVVHQSNSNEKSFKINANVVDFQEAMFDVSK